MKRTLLVLLVVAGLLAPSVALAVEDPEFTAYVPEPTVQPGAPAQVTIQLVNDAAAADERARTATNVKVTPRSAGPVSVKSGTRLLGSMPDGAPAQVPITLSVDANASAGTYRVPLDVAYEYREDGENRSGSTTVYATVRVEPRPRFRVVSTDANASVGNRGTVALTLRNVGGDVADAATVTLQSQSPDVTFGQTNQASRFVGRWPAGETRTVAFDANVAASAERRSYALRATVSYDDGNGTPRQSPPLATGFVPGPEQTFELRNASGALRAGEEGEVRATLANRGPETARDAVVRLTSQHANVVPLSTEYAVGDLRPGESAAFSLPVEVSETATEGPRKFSYVVEYETADGRTVRSEPLSARLRVNASRDRFRVETTDAAVARGGSSELVVAVTNDGDDVVRNVDARLFADDPLSVGDDEAFIPELGPGETATVRFEVGAGGGAMNKTYAVTADFQYEEADGDTAISDSYRLPVRVENAESEGSVPFPALVGGLALAVVIVGGALYLVRR